MRTPKYDEINLEINQIYNNGQVDSLLQKLEFDFQINTKIELSNYILILLILMEYQYSFAASSNLLLRKTLSTVKNFTFIKSSTEIFEIIKENRVFPFVGLSEMIRRLIATIIYNKQEDQTIISNWPTKIYLLEFNNDLLESYIVYPNNPDDTIKNAITLLYNCVDNIDEVSKVYLSKKATSIFRNYLFQVDYATVGYLNCFIRFKWYGGGRQWLEGKLIVPEPFYLQIFESKNDFINFLKYCRLKFDDPDTIELAIQIEDFVNRYDKDENITYDSIDGFKTKLHHYLNEELKKEH